MTAMNRKLEILLRNQGWRQKDLAEKLSVTQTTVSSWICGKKHLSIETIRKFCDMLCFQRFLNCDDLFYEPNGMINLSCLISHQDRWINEDAARVTDILYRLRCSKATVTGVL